VQAQPLVRSGGLIVFSEIIRPGPCETLDFKKQPEGLLPGFGDFYVLIAP